MVQRRVLRADVCAAEGKIPQLHGAVVRGGEAGGKTAAGEILKPVWAALGCGGLVLDDLVGEKGLRGESQVEGVAYELRGGLLAVAGESEGPGEADGEVLAAGSALDVGVRVAEGNAGVAVSDFLRLGSRR